MFGEHFSTSVLCFMVTTFPRVFYRLFGGQPLYRLGQQPGGAVRQVLGGAAHLQAALRRVEREYYLVLFTCTVNSVLISAVWKVLGGAAHLQAAVRRVECEPYLVLLRVQ
jgi:hypothetical protein